MVRAQVTAWSERRSHAGASSVVIMGCPSPAGGGGAVNVSTADHTDTNGYAPLFWRLEGKFPADEVDLDRPRHHGI